MAARRYIERRPQQRGAMVMLWLRDGAKLRDCEIGNRLGITRQSANRMMERLSEKLPIVRIEGYWQWMED